MIVLDDVFSQFGQGLAIDLHNDPERSQVRVHPIQRKTFLDKKLVLGVMVENDFGEQAVNGHDGHLARDLHATSIVFDVLLRLKLPRLVGEPLVMVVPPLRVDEVLAKAFLRVIRRRRIDFAVRINATQAASDFFRVRFFQQQTIKADASMALQVLLDEIGDVFRELYVGEPVGFVEGTDLREFGDFLLELLLFLAEP